MRAFVTGATGFIGGALTRALRADGWDVTALVRDPARAGALEAAGVALARGDVTDSSTLAAPMRGADAVFHLAAWYAIGVRDREAMERTNVAGTESVLGAAANAGVARIVHCSSVAALGTVAGVGDETTEHHGGYGSIYEETKWRAHQIARRFAADGAPVVIVMPGATYGVGDHSVLGVLLRLYARRLLIACPFQDAGLSWVHVDDVGRGIVAAHDKGSAGEEYVIAGDNATIRECFRRVAPITHIRPPMPMPGWIVRAAAPLSPVVGRALGQPPDVIREGLQSLSGSWTYSSDKAARALGYTFRRVEDGVVETVEALRRR